MLNKNELLALLYAHGGEVDKKEICATTGVDIHTLTNATHELSLDLADSGLSLIETGKTLSLRTSPKYSDLVERTLEHEITRDIGQAGLEVLAILLYKKSATRAEIDYIRGVNSSTTIRLLLTRGLITKTEGGTQESPRYQPTPETLAHLSITTESELPEYEEIATLLATQHHA